MVLPMMTVNSDGMLWLENFLRNTHQTSHQPTPFAKSHFVSSQALSAPPKASGSRGLAMALNVGLYSAEDSTGVQAVLLTNSNDPAMMNDGFLRKQCWRWG